MCLGYIILGTCMGVCHAYQCHQSRSVSQLGCNTWMVSLKVHSPVWGWVWSKVEGKGETQRTRQSFEKHNEEAVTVVSRVLSLL